MVENLPLHATYGYSVPAVRCGTDPRVPVLGQRASAVLRLPQYPTLWILSQVPVCGASPVRTSYSRLLSGNGGLSLSPWC